MPPYLLRSLKRVRIPLVLRTVSALTLAAILTSCASGPSGNPAITSAGSGRIPKKADLLFVQSGSSVSFNRKTGQMTLHNVNPITIAFADRPERFAGHMPTSNMVPLWSEGHDSFLKDPPNATLSVWNGNQISSVVMVLRNPRLNGKDLSYDVRLLEGVPPTHGGAASLFIDVIGMPLTPYSYAGAARRSVAYGAYWAGGYSGCTVVHYGTPAAYYGGVYGYRHAYGYGDSGTAVGWRGTASWNGDSGSASGYRGGSAKWDDGSGSAKGWRGGSAKWDDGSGSATGWRGNSVSWKRK